jgi:hypothetical protein
MAVKRQGHVMNGGHVASAPDPKRMCIELGNGE